MVTETHALFTDLYEVAMAQAYLEAGMNDLAVFEVFFRRLPPTRAYVVAAGLVDVLDYLEGLHFRPEDIDYLRSLGSFEEPFLSQLADLRFTGDVAAVPEGTVVFPYEPIVQIIAPIVQAQLAETFVLNQIHMQSVIATKAARVTQAAGERPVIEFGSRRAHGIDAGLKAARLGYLAGAAGTSNLMAGRIYGIPVFGTMAHSFVQAFDDELRAFETFARLYPETTLLVDTYDTLEGVEKVIALRDMLGDRFRVRAVRLDSGDLLQLARETRRRLDAAGLYSMQIFASSGIDEHAIADLLGSGAPIDAFGVGTNLSVSPDAPELDMAYKLVEYAGRPRTKLSEGKAILPGRKQVFRTIDDGRMQSDVISEYGTRHPGQPLLEYVMRGGRRMSTDLSLQTMRTRWREQLDMLPPELRPLEGPFARYLVAPSAGITHALRRLGHRPGQSTPDQGGSPQTRAS